MGKGLSKKGCTVLRLASVRKVVVVIVAVAVVLAVVEVVCREAVLWGVGTEQ